MGTVLVLVYVATVGWWENVPVLSRLLHRRSHNA